jgi:predicted enzyme related to lactoylglutathione lyase
MHRRTGVTTSGGGIRRATTHALAAGIVGLALACASTPELPRLPAVTTAQTDLAIPGKFVWADLVTHDLEASKAFYAGLFGWTYETDGRYTTVRNGGRRIAGFVQGSQRERGTEWVGNLSVADVDASAAILAREGMLIELEPTDAPDRGRIALVSSKDGALLMLVRSSRGDPPDADPEIGSWFWWELWTHDPERSLDVIAEMTGLVRETIDLDGVPYRVVRDAQARRFGIVDAPPEVKPLWLPLFRVEDVEASVKRAVELGARLIDAYEKFAILQDPNRAEFAIGTWSKETDRIRQEAE